MRRAIARGRIVPQSLSTDPRLGRLSLKAALLFPLMWINSDDQGRLSGDPDEIKYATCPNIDHITKADIPELLKELEKQGFIKVYATSKTMATQMLDWWEEQRLQWAYPSLYSPPGGWMDHLRYHPTPKEIITENWPPSALPSKLPSELPNPLGSKLQSEVSQTLPNEKEKRKGKGNRRGRGILPSALGSRSPPSLVTIALLDNFPKAFGRRPNNRELAYLRDIEKEISAAGATAEQVRDAFKEAAKQNKLHLSYVRAVLLDWLGIARGPP
ncbi:hypothetical protein ES703_73236 [subsurface metagenome]